MVTVNSESLAMLSIESFSTVSPVLLTIAIILSTVGQQWHRLLCGLCIIIPTLAHYHWFNESTGAVYYGSAMAFSSMGLALLQFVKPNKLRSQLVVHLQLASLAFVVINFIGYFMWYAYMSPMMYNWSCLVLAVIEAARLLIHTNGDKEDGIDGRYYNRNSNDTKRGLGSRG